MRKRTANRRARVYPVPSGWQGIKPRPTVRRAISRSEPDTARLAARLAATLRGGEVLLLEGDLGAGKTAFVRGLARALGVRGRVTSPTFVLVREYRIARPETRDPRPEIRPSDLTSHVSRLTSLIHADAYRLRDPRELLHAGLADWIGRRDAVIAVEWGERLAPLLRGVPIIRLRFTVGRTEHARTIIITRRAGRHRASTRKFRK